MYLESANEFEKLLKN